MAADIIINGTRLCATYGLVLETVSNQPPEVYTSYIEVPGRNGLVDLSGIGGVHYKNRQMQFVLHATEHTLSAETTLSKIKAMLHGREHDFCLSWDYEYIYHGRFACAIEQPTAQNHQQITISISAEPFKRRIYRFSARYGGVFPRNGEFYAGAKFEQPKVVVSGAPCYVVLSNYDTGAPRFYNENDWISIQRCEIGENLLAKAVGQGEKIYIRVFDVDAATRADMTPSDTWSYYQDMTLSEFIGSTRASELGVDYTWDFYADYENMESRADISFDIKEL